MKRAAGGAPGAPGAPAAGAAVAMLCLGAWSLCAGEPGEPRDPVPHREYRRISTWIAQLGHAETGKRAHAAFVLGNIGSKEGIGPMVKRLAAEPKKNSRVVLALCYALGQLKAKAAYLLELGALGHADAGVRNHAAWALGEIGFASCSGELVGLLADGDAMVRRRAAESLRKLSGKSFGYDPRGEPPGRATAAAKWSAWWKREGEALRKKEAGELRKLFGAAAQGRIIGATRAGEER